MCGGQTGLCSKWEGSLGWSLGGISLREERATLPHSGKGGLGETTLKVAWFLDPL